MKTMLLIFAVVNLLTVFFLSSSGGQTTPKPGTYAGNQSIVSRFLAQDFVPDGNLEKKIWSEAETVTFDMPAGAGKRYPESSTRVASAWTAGYVYFAYWCRYTSLNYYEGESTAKERWKLWDRDVVEVFINPEPARFHHYYEFEVAPNNQWIDLEIDLQKTPFNDARWDSHFEHAARIDEQNRIWTCEMRVPTTSMGIEAIKAGMEWRLNFYRADGPGDDTQRRFLSWGPLAGPKLTFHQPASFGIIRFMKR